MRSGKIHRSGRTCCPERPHRSGKTLLPILIAILLVTCSTAACGNTAQSGADTAASAASSLQAETASPDAGDEKEEGTEASGSGKGAAEEQETTDAVQEGSKAPSWPSLERTGSLDLAYAKQFGVDTYGDYQLITIGEDEQELLLVPEGVPVPTDIPDGIVVLQQPLDHTCLVSTSVMDYIVTIGALDDITLSGTKADDWYIPEAREAMEDGRIQYAGKYSAPDYELIIGSSCNFVLENTMIYHNPEVKEKLESLGIPVMVERSSYETDPFGRLEWIRLYGILYDRQEEADSWFQKEMDSLQSVLHEAATGKTVAYFSVTSNGAVTIRKPGDYISKMISLAGGTYAITDLPGNTDETAAALSTMNIQFEEFYQQAWDADVLIYNSTIEGELQGMEDLVAKNALFEDFKAVKEGNVWTTGSNFFQHPTGMGTFILDLHAVLTGEERALTYLQKLE